MSRCGAFFWWRSLLAYLEAHGTPGTVEAVGGDLNISVPAPFQKIAKAPRAGTVVFAYFVYRSCEHGNEVSQVGNWRFSTGYGVCNRIDL